MRNYFMIGDDINYSNYVSELKVHEIRHYTEQTNAAGNKVVDYINSKREIEVTFIPMSGDEALVLFDDMGGYNNGFNVPIKFFNPKTNEIATANCILPDTNIEYYTIRTDKTILKAFTLRFIEL